MNTYKLLVHSAEQIVQVTSKGERCLKGKEMKTIAILRRSLDGDGCSIVIGQDGDIVAVGYDSEVSHQQKNATYDKVINATGKCIIPGLIDAHTHPVWAGDRVHEFAMKLAGASYMEIHEAGGGIGFTVAATKRASEDELYESLKERLLRMLSCGTTLAEVKSGYGLDAEHETKLIIVLNRAKELPIDLSITHLGAHSIPKGFTSEEATKKVIEEQIPAIEYLKSINKSVDNIDVFCEKGVFDLKQSELILTAGKDLGLHINFHGDELSAMGAAEMGASLNAVAISHLEEVSAAGIKKMAEHNCVAVLLPTTAFLLKLKPPPARELINAGVAVALGTDFNPNCFCLSMPITMYLATIIFNMSMEEALAAATINAAASLKKSNDYGSLEVGKHGDMVIINASKWEHLIYQLGAHDHLIENVIKDGDIVHMRNGKVNRRRSTKSFLGF